MPDEFWEQRRVDQSEQDSDICHRSCDAARLARAVREYSQRDRCTRRRIARFLDGAAVIALDLRDDLVRPQNPRGEHRGNTAQVVPIDQW
jgi:hypothetical protein